MITTPRRAGAALALLLGVGLLAACTGGGSGGASTSGARSASSPPASSQGVATPVPVHSGPTTAAHATRCPLVTTSFVRFTMGLRLGRLTVLHSGGKIVGCRFYPLGHPNAQCDATCFKGEHLPPASQPAVEVVVQRYTDTDGAHNAFVLAADKGTNPQPVTLHGHPGVCFQNDFYAKDKGQDWACGTSKGATEVLVRTVDTTGTIGTMAVTRTVLERL